MRRRHQIVLFTILLLSLTILSPSFDFRGTQLNPEQDLEKDHFPNKLSRNEDIHSPVEIVVSMTEEEFHSFQRLANKVAASQFVEIRIRNLKPDTYKQVLDHELLVGENGDIILLDSSEVQYHAKRGHLYPLNGTTLSKSLGETLVGLREMTEWNGYQWGMPFDLDSYVLAARSSFLDEAGVESLPDNKEQWVKLIQQAAQDRADLITMNMNDTHAADAWLNEFGPGMAPHTLQKAQTSSQTEEYHQAIELLDQIQPHIEVDITNPTLSSTVNQKGTPMVVTLLSRLLSEQQMDAKKGSTEKVTLSALKPLKSRSLVIAAGSLEADEASRWIEGMTSSAAQSDWYQQVRRLPAKQKELDLESQKLTDQYDMASVKLWFPTESIQTKTNENFVYSSSFQKKVQQLLKGEVTANQYVNSIMATETSSK